MGLSALGPLTLEGQVVRLEPLNMTHFSGLLQAAQDSRIWPWLSMDLSDSKTLEKFIRLAMEQERRNWSYTFAVIMKDSGRIVGSTRYLDISRHDRTLEIGWTWYHPSVWGSKVNPECKYLLLRHAFVEWGAIRVVLKTDHLNQHSQRAIEKLGAVFEGRLRNHRIRPDGSIRDTLLYSIIDTEWPAVRETLLSRLDVSGTTV
ncbi:GNAT family N-acetyltransferase [Sulfobacillus thermosulfidooxidans]|uniref:GNAT family N-acetyltransferase n=1 Tax=Sulfobacillus thermosulfidooxidans TaxID=28034 RepID=UPI0006B50732|nr:GNAT family protein [Sulfobacillus thermosulfidooxidans]